MLATLTTSKGRPSAAGKSAASQDDIATSNRPKQGLYTRSIHDRFRWREAPFLEAQYREPYKRQSAGKSVRGQAWKEGL